jgi:hypothetical protein
MQDWSIPLILATAAFLGLLVWRVRPALSFLPRRRASWAALRDARARIESAPDDPARALALCDAADLMAKRVTGGANAAGLYQRAMRTDPNSAEVVARAAAGLAGRPRALESLLWRHLGLAAWTSKSRQAARASLDALRVLYEGPLRNAVRARALANARDALTPEGESRQDTQDARGAK